ncbi:MAG TPA: bifunctional 5,10-methylenetetrahydrofolate dehydrogenase/5,10-methenyltetrahydrofolate cyclohydrolase [Thermoplasmata archaeon]|nr:bifunctional 5,10-methylenetetrahydrofolate dehydrogenase/5,10-methenyltetrahydrofolate cyclohydrolase [Thermoplasmata archaeon]
MRSVTQRLDGKPVAEAILARVRSDVERHAAEGCGPVRLASLYVEGPGAFESYLAQQRRSAERAGVQLEPVPVSSPEELLTRVGELNADPTIPAVLLQHPLPPGYDFRSAIDQLQPEKDVDGAGAVNLGRLVAGAPLHVPAVALAVRELLVHYRIPLGGARVLVIGRSATVGLPLALLLLLRGETGDATVEIAHSKSRDLGKLLKEAEVVVSCAGIPGLLRRENVPSESVVVDVGLSYVADPSRAGGRRSAGDAAPELDGWVRALSPVPGGIGPLTVAELMANVMSAERQLEEHSE